MLPRSLTHVIEGKVYISSILSFDYMLQSYKVIMSRESLQVHDLPESALCIGGVPESVEALLQG